MAMRLPPGFELEGDSGAANLPAGFVIEQGENQGEGQPGQQSEPRINPYAEMAMNAVGMSPLGMAAKGAGAIQGAAGALTQPFIRVPESVQRPVSSVFRGSRALGVGTALNTFMPQTPASNLNTAQRMQAAYQPDYQPANRLERTGAFIGQNAPVLAATALSPAVGAPLAMTGQQIAETGKFSPIMAGTASIPLFSKAAGSMAPIAARRALGFQKPFLKTKFARGQATKAAQTALDEGVIPYSGNPTTMLDRATGLAATEGQKIGQVLKKTPADAGAAMENLEMVRSELTQGVSGGIYSGVNNAINTVQQSIAELSKVGGNLSLRNLNAIKSKIGNSINYLSDQAAQSENKAIVSNLANTIRNTIKDYIPPEEFASFLKSQKLYSAASLMKKGLNNEVAGQMSNMPISLPSIGGGVGSAILTGNPAKAAASTGLFEIAKRRGAGTTARALSDLNKASTAVSGAAVGGMLGNTLTPKLAKEYLKRANGNKQKARGMALIDGWRIPEK